MSATSFWLGMSCVIVAAVLTTFTPKRMPWSLLLIGAAILALCGAISVQNNWGYWDTTKATKTLIDTKSKVELPELEKRFPGGFEAFGAITGGSATTGHTIIKSSTSYGIDVTWGNAAITELTPRSLTIQLQNLRIARTETTPSGIKPTGEININGAAIWRIDRGTKLVYINNALSFWGYVLGGYVLSDTGDVLVVAIGLQKSE
jgi:hypothetical protein